MPRNANFPTTVEDCLFLSAKKLNNWNCFTNNGTMTGTVNWSKNGTIHSSIHITATKNDNETCITLEYKSNGEPKSYKVEIISKPSNLGKGKVLYFICPNTGKYCRKLYLYNGYFLHREAFKGLMYENQILSKKTRSLYAIFDRSCLSDSVYQELYQKYFKTHYNGKETKRYKKMYKIIVSERYPKDTVERLMMM